MTRFRPPLLFALFALFLAGCAVIPRPTASARLSEGGPLGRCADFFSTLDQRAVEARALDPGAFRPEGFPYLRVNRFLASFRGEVQDRAAFAAWVEQMQALDLEARRHEIANMSLVSSPDPDTAGDQDALARRVVACGDLLKDADSAAGAQRVQLRNRSTAPDEYLTLRRVLGLYPLAYPFIHHGVIRWHAETRGTFTNAAPAGWRTVRYVPPPADGLPPARQIIATARRDALGIPLYSTEAREALFRIYAPAWEVRTEGDDDRIGAPYWTARGELAVRTGEPVTFTLLSYTRFGKEVLTQLNYVIWFPSRPKEGFLDLYGGLLDGVNYRVTLDKHGDPLLYESVHNCGCYYAAYPTDRLKVRRKIAYSEPPLILKAPERTPSGPVMALAMDSRTHYVQHLYTLPRATPPTAVTYMLVPYGRLLQLPGAEGGRRSMFSGDAIAPGSERLERWILWPSGVLSPGAMRQWGRHAVAFVGERHFDDPFYMDEMFEPAAAQ